MSFYKLIQFLKTFINLQRIKTPIIIFLCIVQKWLSKLGYKYKDKKKAVFIDGHKQCDIMKDYKKLFKKINAYFL